jgi:hypothetical protein
MNGSGCARMPSRFKDVLKKCHGHSRKGALAKPWLFVAYASEDARAACRDRGIRLTVLERQVLPAEIAGKTPHDLRPNASGYVQPRFDLGKTIDEIKDALKPKLFSELDNKTFLRMLGAAAGGDFSAGSMEALRQLDAGKLAEAAELVKSAATLAADFLATEIHALRAEALPYANQFVVLSEIFRLIPHPTDIQLREIKRWFWR